MSDLAEVLLIGAAVFALMGGATYCIWRMGRLCALCIATGQALLVACVTYARRWEAPPAGRAWWEWVSLSSTLTSLTIITWMMADSIHEAPPRTIDLAFAWTANQSASHLLAFVQTLTSAFMFATAASFVLAASGLPSSVLRGLSALLAGMCATSACYAFGTVVLLSNPYLGRFVLLSVLRTVTCVICGTEFLIHGRYIREAILAPVSDGEKVRAFTELRDFARGGS